MKHNAYTKFLERWNEVVDIPPQTVGPLTPYYKYITKRLKVMPFPALLLFSLVFVGALAYILGSSITLLASLLQRGF